MPDREELYNALRKADAAGNAEDARKIADYIRSLPQESAQPAAVAEEPQPERSRFEAARAFEAV